MSVVKFTDVIEVSAEVLFDISQNYALRKEWDPFPESYVFHGTSPNPEAGAELTVRARNGFTMRVRYVSYMRPRVAAIEMLSGPWFIHKFAGAWVFSPLTATSTEVSFKYNVVAQPLLKTVVQPVLLRSFARHARSRLLALKSHAEKVKQSDA